MFHLEHTDMSNHAIKTEVELPTTPYVHSKLVRPFVKWVGGKRQLLSDINRLRPKKFGTYYEPFVGGGAVLLHLQPKVARVADVNEELVNLYKVIRDNPEALIEDLDKHVNEEDYFYEIRSIDRDSEAYQALTDIARASRIIFLNKTCFNGLYRVNNSGEFNAPFGRYKNPAINDKDTIRAVHRYLAGNDFEIDNADFEKCVSGAKKGDFVYFDPPYDPVSDSANFTGYSRGGFNRSDQRRLRDLCDRLDKKGVNFMVSNSSTDFIKNIYSEYPAPHIVKAKRAINSNGNDRGNVDEVIICNYGKKDN